MADADTLTLDQTEDRLTQMLTQAGVDPKAATLSQVWPVFQAFARIPLAGEEEVQILVQWGTSDFYIKRRTFQFDLTRQYSIEPDDESEGIIQLHCIFFFEPTPDFAALKGNMWSMDHADLDAFFAAVEAQDAFMQSISLGTPIETLIEQEEAG